MIGQVLILIKIVVCNKSSQLRVFVMSENNKGFTVNDRRLFGSGSEEDGATQETAEKVDNKAHDREAASLAEEPDKSENACQQELDSNAYRNLPPVAFGTFIISLTHAAMMHLGHVEDPSGRPVERNLDLARHTIDTLAMLKEKTKGNLDQEEDSLLTSILTELRMLYVQTCKSQ